MGLDMYLTLEKYLSSWQEDEAKVAASFKRRLPELRGLSKDVRVKNVEVEVGYWRKANQIHQWFVANCQEGRDECQKTYVEVEKLEALLADCETVLKNKGKALDVLPPQAGFFFGSTRVDEYYWEDIKHTIKILKPLIKKMREGALKGWYCYYHASW